MRRPIHLLSRALEWTAWGFLTIGNALVWCSVYLEERDRQRRCVEPPTRPSGFGGSITINPGGRTS